MIINNVKLVLKDEVIDNGYIEISEKYIKSYGKNPSIKNEKYMDGKGMIVMPGYIDLHTHGACGIDFMDASEDDFLTVANAIYQEGTTTFLATTLTSDFNSLCKICGKVNAIYDKIPSLYGIHMEGPYISDKYKGAQNPKYIRLPDIEEFTNLQEIANGKIKYITLAPENDNSLDFIKSVTSKGVVCSVGHSNASFNDVKNAIEAGLTNVTHTHNAMSGYHHREPGVLSAALYFDNLFCEVICDKIHVCEDTLKTFYKLVGPERFMIITDSLSAKYCDNEKFKLFGLDCVKKNGAAYLESGPLAGSLLTMEQGVKNMKELTNASLCDLARISSYNQAKSLGLEDRGEIAVGKLADLVFLDDSLNVKKVYKEGIKVV